MKTQTSGISKIWSINEWGKLCEVLLGDPRGAFLPSMDDISQRNYDRLTPQESSKVVPRAMPDWVIDETLEDIESLAKVLTNLGVTVHRADRLDSTVPIHTPYWTAQQETAINIRDMTLIHGNLVIDAASPTRGRYFESFAVRDLFDDYRNRLNHAWFAAPPRPRLFENTYDLTRPRGINNTEPLFEAANCVRLGRHVIVDVNNTANDLGVDWIRQAFDRHFGPGTVTVHSVSLSPDHIDVIIVPLCEGHALINPEYVKSGNLPDCITAWDLIPAPDMVPQPYFSSSPKASNWIGLNLLVIDGEERTVIVEERQLPLIRKLEQLGFRPIPVRWRHGRTWGGSFHCVTLDVHRLGDL